MDSLILLSNDEQRELERHEATIERGLKTFVEVGNALAAIRDARLYRPRATFEEYCRERWGMTRQHINRLVAASEVVGVLEPTGSILPSSERQARPLTFLPPEQQPIAWQRAIETAPDGKMTAAHVQRVVDEMRAPSLPFDYEGEEEEEELAPIPAPTDGRAPRMDVHYSSDTPEWYTPAHIIARVFQAMGRVDLDPCSNSHEKPNVPAVSHFTQEDDGLTQAWHGRVYMNPPYGRGIGEWVERLIGEFDAGRVTEAIALVPARTDTEWFRALRRFPRCFIHGRLKFLAPGDNDNSAPFPSVAIYLGSNLLAFTRAFGDIGDVYQLVEG